MNDPELYEVLREYLMRDATLYSLWGMKQKEGWGEHKFLLEATRALAKDKKALYDQLVWVNNHSPAPPMVLLRDTKSWRELTPGQQRVLRFFAKLGIGRKETL